MSFACGFMRVAARRNTSDQIETTVLTQRRLGVDLAGRALDTQVALIRALGGGWQCDPAASVVATRRNPAGSGTP